MWWCFKNVAEYIIQSFQTDDKAIILYYSLKETGVTLGVIDN